MINNAPIALEVEILAKNNKIYKYGFEVLKDTIISEWLFEKRVNIFFIYWRILFRVITY